MARNLELVRYANYHASVTVKVANSFLTISEDRLRWSGRQGFKLG